MTNEKTTSVYRDARFWLVLGSLLILALLAARSYPM